MLHCLGTSVHVSHQLGDIRLVPFPLWVLIFSQARDGCSLSLPSLGIPWHQGAESGQSRWSGSGQRLWPFLKSSLAQATRQVDHTANQVTWVSRSEVNHFLKTSKHTPFPPSPVAFPGIIKSHIQDKAQGHISWSGLTPITWVTLASCFDHCGLSLLTCEMRVWGFRVVIQRALFPDGFDRWKSGMGPGHLTQLPWNAPPLGFLIPLLLVLPSSSDP